MDFNQIRYFLALADTLNFTRAAENCYVTQPALTQAIKRLETELGGELIHRSGRDNELTELGKSLRSHFEQIDRTRHLVRTTAKAFTQGEIGEFNIGLMCTIGPIMLTRILDDFQTANPMVSLLLHDVSPEMIGDLLVSGGIDGAFCSQRGEPDPRLSYIDLFDEPMVVAFPDGHAFAELNTVPLKTIAQERYVDRLNCEFRPEFLEYCKHQGIKLDVSFRSEREDWIQSMVRAGMGVTVIPRSSLIRPRLQFRPVDDPSLSRTVKFAYPRSAEPAPILGRLIDHAMHFDWKSEQGRAAEMCPTPSIGRLSA